MKDLSMPETIGTLIDEMTLVEIERWHLREQSLDQARKFSFRMECAQEIELIDRKLDGIHDDIRKKWSLLLRIAPS